MFPLPARNSAGQVRIELPAVRHELLLLGARVHPSHHARLLDEQRPSLDDPLAEDAPLVHVLEVGGEVSNLLVPALEISGDVGGRRRGLRA
jgi:hypothetical protein